MKSYLILIIVFFFILALIQSTFLAYLGFYGSLFNLILISVILINFFENPKNYSGVVSAIFGGFFLDIFSSRPFGFWILISFLLSLFIKFIIRKRVRIPFITRV